MDDIERRRYTPVRCRHDDNMFRVPVWVNGDDICVCVGDNSFRYYLREFAPKELKAALSMVNAFPFKPRPEWAVGPSSAFHNVVLTDDMELESIKNQADVGWRVTEDMYILILPRNFLEDIYMRD